MNDMHVQVMGLDELKKRLGGMAPAARSIMKIAVNETAMDARRMMVDRVRKVYMVKSGAFNRAMRLKKATGTSLTATLHSAGKPIPLRGFAYKKHDVESGEAAKAHQLRGRRNVPLEKDGNKAFYARMPTGHTGVFERIKGSAMKSRWKKGTDGKIHAEKRPKESKRRKDKNGRPLQLKPREQIRELFGSSIPVMFGGTRTYDVIKPFIQDTLNKKLENYIEQVLRRL